ncbi:MAG: argininosuccinate lyase [ANME-2 cluster archaeon]|nr:argininosuccinate lyase [ANME-2 cluster archaeon]MBC2699915.1 argininosuccinate lyase [ANME-2 cluster archaeon]MBC2707378.1 argininosuccinate lyase [ANME-2 cluster archaeon]MBC2748660.1 argininosuccinate lyase [ANME-2 cluster archaeon]
MNNILRRGRLGLEQDPDVLDYLSSMDADRMIFDADLLVDMAHVVMLSEVGIITNDDCVLILGALDTIKQEGFEGLDMSYEDLHISIEAKLINLVGEDTGGRMHSARSRNDEVATCIRIRLRDELLTLMHKLITLRKTMLELAREHTNTLMPGFTHLQHAQPTTFAHHLLAHHDALSRDTQRLLGAYMRTNMSPLGAAAFASTGFAINRERTRELLGFDEIVENSMDAVSTRDFVLESISVFSNIMTNLSRIAEEIISWSSEEFGFVELDDQYASTSSIMPQKKNPDTAELLRGKTGTVYGCLMSVLTITKALSMSYNRDLQEVTPHMWRAAGTTISSVIIMAGMLPTMKINTEKMESTAGTGFSTATELADTIVRTTEISFRTAHQIVGTLSKSDVRTLEELDRIALEITGRKLSDEGLSQEMFDGALDVMENVKRRNVVGGPSPVEVSRMIEERNYQLSLDINTLMEKTNFVQDAMKKLDNIKDSFIERGNA